MKKLGRGLFVSNKQNSKFLTRVDEWGVKILFYRGGFSLIIFTDGVLPLHVQV
jgi:hypothetical protein